LPSVQFYSIGEHVCIESVLETTSEWKCRLISTAENSVRTSLTKISTFSSVVRRQNPSIFVRSLSLSPDVCCKGRRGLTKYIYTANVYGFAKGEYNSCEIMLSETLIFFSTPARPPTARTAYVETRIYQYFYLNLRSAEESLRAVRAHVYIRVYIYISIPTTESPESRPPFFRWFTGGTDFRFNRDKWW